MTMGTTSAIGNIRRTERYHAGHKEIVYTINIDWHGNPKKQNTYKWYLWEVENQKDRPPNMILAMINGDQDDIRLDNMEVITRSELARRNKGKK